MLPPQSVDPIDLWAVRRWAIAEGLPRDAILAHYRAALLRSIACLVQAIYREKLARCELVEDAGGACALVIAKGALRLFIPVREDRLFTALEVQGLPYRFVSGEQRVVRSAGAFLKAIAAGGSTTLAANEAPARSDFENSLANLILNAILASRAPPNPEVGEPVYEGHAYFPFPALRIGPSIADVAACSNLHVGGVVLQCAELASADFTSISFADASTCFKAWSGVAHDDTAILLPIHPWQWKCSPVVRELVSLGFVAPARTPRIEVIPLTSQRSCQVVRTGYTLKLSLNAALTGERRLLHQLNCVNAPGVSTLAASLVREAGSGDGLGFQRDVASLAFSDLRFSPHLSMIVREPLLPAFDETLVPAINLWSPLSIASVWLPGQDDAIVARFVEAYCRVVVGGPLRWLVRDWMAFEPHLQNAIIGFRSGLPDRLVLRDLDSALLGPAISDVARRRDLALLHPETWASMPSFEVGERRCVHALFFGHLRLVFGFLWAHRGFAPARSGRILEQALETLYLELEGPTERARLRRVLMHLGVAKQSLTMRLARSSEMQFNPLPRRAGRLVTALERRLSSAATKRS